MKRSIYRSFSYLLAAVVILGTTMTSCKSKKDVAKVKGEEIIEIHCHGVEYQSDKNHFRASSIGESSDQVIAKKKAYSNAKAELAGLIQTVIKGTTDNYVNSREFNNVEEVEERFETLTREVINQQLNDVRIICEKHARTAEGKYKTYVALEMAGDALEKAINDRLSRDQRLKVDYDYEKYKETFDKEMEKLENSGGY